MIYQPPPSDQQPSPLLPPSSSSEISKLKKNTISLPLNNYTQVSDVISKVSSHFDLKIGEFILVDSNDTEIPSDYDVRSLPPLPPSLFY